MLVTTIIIVTAVPFTALQSVTRDLLARSATKAVAGTTLAAAAVNIGLNVVLIPAFGINGAAIATFLAYAAAYPTAFLALVDTYDTLRSGLPNFLVVALVRCQDVP